MNIAARLAAITMALACAACGGGDELAPTVAGARPQAQFAAARLAATDVMDWAEQVFPTIFPGHPSQVPIGAFSVRAYGNGNYIGSIGDSLYILGPALTGGVPVRVGSVADFTCRVLASLCAQSGAAVAGTVLARGSALAGARITLRDSAGGSRTAIAGATGIYSLPVDGLLPPYVITATGSSGGTAYTLYSVSESTALSGTQRVNVSAWTSALAAMLSPTGRAADLDAAQHFTRIETTLTQVITYSRTLLAPTLADNGLSTTGYDPIADADPLPASGNGGGGVDRQTQTGLTPSNAVFIGPACSTNQLGSCPRYSYPPAATTTNPNVCGSDIASGAPILCDPTKGPTATPAAIGIVPSQAYSFGCSGCVFWGPADNYAAAPVQTAIRVSTFTFTGSASVDTGGTGGTGGTAAGSETWQATFSASVCTAGICVSGGSSTSATSYNAQASCSQAAAIIAQTLNAQAIAGFSYSFSCRRIA